MKITTFETAKVGDRVWSIMHGWGFICAIKTEDNFPIKVIFDELEESYLYSGVHINRWGQTLFWDEIEIEAPEKPIPELEVDTKVVVWHDDHIKYNRYFAGWCELTGLIMVYDYGATSWSASGPSTWPNWELAE